MEMVSGVELKLIRLVNMTNKNFLSILIGFIFLLSCDTNKFNDQKKRPYDNSKQKLVKKFYDTGNLMYYGK